MHRSRFIYLAAADAGIIASFLPWENISVLGTVSDSHSGTQIVEHVLGTVGVGWISMALFAIAALTCFTGRRALPVGGFAKWTLLLMGLLATVVGVHTYQDIGQKSILNPSDSGGLSFESSAAVGVYIAIAAGVALIFLPFLFKAKHSENGS
ncbi:MAG: hypothetical protein ABIX01_00610 [Chitinophagaceae bacterium]